MKKLTIRFKLYGLQGLYLFLDVFANITYANQYVVRKKIYVGAAIISLTLSLSLCTSPTDKAQPKNNKKNSAAEATSTCYVTITDVRIPSKIGTDTTPKKTKRQTKKIKPHVRNNEPIVLCYDVVEVGPETPNMEDDTLFIVDQMPSFKGGIDSMHQFINRNLKYPQEMADIDVIGRVIVQFTVTDKGDVVNPKVLRSLHPSLDNEAIRVIKLMPKWIPGKQGGIERNVRFTLPILFQLN